MAKLQLPMLILAVNMSVFLSTTMTMNEGNQDLGKVIFLSFRFKPIHFSLFVAVNCFDFSPHFFLVAHKLPLPICTLLMELFKVCYARTVESPQQENSSEVFCNPYFIRKPDFFRGGGNRKKNMSEVLEKYNPNISMGVIFRTIKPRTVCIKKSVEKSRGQTIKDLKRKNREKKTSF